MIFPDPPPGCHGWPWVKEPEAYPPFMPDETPWPRVTIVTPSLNQGIFLEETIRSVLLQGYPNLEYIIMDGGSTDQSVDIIQKYSPWLSSWFSEKDEGQSSAINKGFKRAGGNYIAWLNSDDVFLPNVIRKVVERFCADPQAGMVYGQVDVINDVGLKVGIFEPVHYRFYDLLTMKIILPQQAAFFRKSVLEAIGYLREDLHYAMDMEFFIRIGKDYDIVAVDETLAQFRLSMINKGIASKANWCLEFLKIVDDFFNDPDLKEDLINLRSEAYAGAYYRGAHTYLEVYQFGNACKWLFLAASHNRKYLIKPGWWKNLLLALSGKPLNHILREILAWMRIKRLHINETDWSTGLAANNWHNKKD